MGVKKTSKGLGERGKKGKYFLPAELSALKHVLGFKTLTLLLTLCVVVPRVALAGLVVTEIMYDLPSGSDSGREWIEIYNSGATPVDLTKLKLFENGTNHKIAGIAGALALAPAAYGVIADNPTKFKTDWPTYSGPLFDSTFALGNDGDSLELRDASSTALDSIAFIKGLGAAGDGNSLNREPSRSTFTPHTPSPGAAMSSGVVAPKVNSIAAPKVVAAKKSSASKPVGVAPVSGGEISQQYPTSTSDILPERVVLPEVEASDGAMPAWQWWIAALALALASAGAIALSRHYAKDEWNIVEDTSE